MKVKDMVVKLLGIDPETEVYIHLPEQDDDFPLSDVTVEDPEGDGDVFVRISFRP